MRDVKCCHAFVTSSLEFLYSAPLLLFFVYIQFSAVFDADIFRQNERTDKTSEYRTKKTLLKKSNFFSTLLFELTRRNYKVLLDMLEQTVMHYACTSCIFRMIDN